jgi:hypothetical protein
MLKRAGAALPDVSRSQSGCAQTARRRVNYLEAPVVVDPRRQRLMTTTAAPASMVSSPISHSPDRGAPVKASAGVVTDEVAGDVVAAGVLGDEVPELPELPELGGVVVGFVTTAVVATT